MLLVHGKKRHASHVCILQVKADCPWSREGDKGVSGRASGSCIRGSVEIVSQVGACSVVQKNLHYRVHASKIAASVIDIV